MLGGRAGRIKLSACRHGLRRWVGGASIDTLDGPLTLTDEEVLQLGDVLPPGMSPPDQYYQGGEPPPSDSLWSACLESREGVVGYGLWRRGVQRPLPERVQILRASGTPGDRLAADHYLHLHLHTGGEPILWQAPVICLSGDVSGIRSGHQYRCQVLLIDSTLSTNLQQLQPQTTADYILFATTWSSGHPPHIYRRTVAGYQLMGVEETVAEGTPGVGPPWGYPTLRYPSPPDWWIGDRPPPSPGYYVNLVTPIATLWRRSRAKGAHTAR